MRRASPEPEISLLDVIGLLRNNLKTLLLSALIFSAIGVGLVLLRPPEYQKQVTLSVTPVTSPSLGRLVQESDRLDVETLRPDEAGQLAVGYLRERNLAGMETSPRYDKNVQQIEVSMTSQDRDTLKGAVPDLVGLTREGFQDVNEESLDAALESQRVEVSRAIEVNERVVAQLEGEAAALPDDEVARLQALANSRQSLLTEIAEAEIRLEDLERARGDLPRLAADLISVAVVDESGVSQTRSPIFMLALAVAAALVAATLITLVLRSFGKKA